jgi:hypothetical protein
MDDYLTKGDRVTATWIDAEPKALSGVQIKVSGEFKTVTGVVTHIRGDHPINPTSVGVAIMDDEGLEHWVDLNFVRKYHA